MQESAKICNASSISIPHSYSDYILKGVRPTASLESIGVQSGRSGQICPGKQEIPKSRLDVQFPLPCKVLSHLEGQAMECGRYKPGQCSLSRMCYVYQSDKDQSDGLFSLRKKERSEVMQNKQQQRIQAPSIDGELIKEQIHKHRHTMQCFTRFSGTPSSEGSESIIQAYESGTTGSTTKQMKLRDPELLGLPKRGILLCLSLSAMAYKCLGAFHTSTHTKQTKKSNPKLYNISGSSLYPQAPFFFLFLTLLAGSRNYLTSGTTELDYSFFIKPVFNAY
ncbi:hypothetical protein L1987_89923 [Smallanthus sonchifolius]|nr:hypothetical protein L1987_89923 [Smallanthus sonchifolius]